MTTATAWHNGPTDNRLPLWLRVTLVAEERGYNGVALLDWGELKLCVDPTGATSATVAAAAVRLAVKRGLLAPGSSPRALVIGPVATSTRTGVRR